MYPKIGMVNSSDFSRVTKMLRKFFDSKGFIEAHPQSRLSILAACEDPSTISTYNYAGKLWPLPQTGQMWLEYELLSNPQANGYYCVSTSYRNEPNPVPGRHELIFPMFEFEMKGGMDKMIELEKELLDSLGFSKNSSGAYPEGDYVDIANKFNVKELENEHEELLRKEYGPVFFLKNFPNYSSPFWNMEQDKDSNVEGGSALKVDVIINGTETIGSAQRATNPSKMHEQFYTISDGEYARKLFSCFGRERVEKELEDFLNFDFFERSGGGIGVTRLIKGMKDCGL